VGCLYGCGGGLPRPLYVAQTTDALSSVQYPPPPARVEFVPKRPAPGAVWIDGEWIWRQQRWDWKVGRWVMPPSGARFAPWAVVLSEDGSVFYAPGGWRDASDRPLADPVALATARVAGGEVEDPEGQAEKTGRTLRPQTP
jgi:hypothetical protein